MFKYAETASLKPYSTVKICKSQKTCHFYSPLNEHGCGNTEVQLVLHLYSCGLGLDLSSSYQFSLDHILFSSDRGGIQGLVVFPFLWLTMTARLNRHHNDLKLVK